MDHIACQGLFWEILDELRELRELVDRYVTPAKENPDDLVDCSYIAKRTGLKERTIRDGKAGTDSLPRVALTPGKRSPVRFRRLDADRWIRSRLVQLPAREQARRAINRRSKGPRAA
jgi:hypothetical protein